MDQNNTHLNTTHASVMNDPIHGVMSFEGELRLLLKDIIDHDVFQRLRHIKQLGMTDLVFPSAVHTRFNHCIGACYVALQMAHHLNLSLSEKKHVLAATVLHDIGHGPFSHAFEKFLVHHNGQMIRHELWTPYFLRDFDAVFQRHGLDKSILLNLISSKGGGPKSIAASIVSSQLDADRLDYLLRDSHFCGVLYGKADIQWILKHLTVVADPKTGSPAIGVRRKGWRAVEHFLLCRRMMTYNVYRHPKKEIIEKTLVYFLTFLMQAVENEAALIQKLEIPINTHLRGFLQKAHLLIQGTLTPDAFLEEAFVPYQILTDVDLWMQIRDLATRRTALLGHIPCDSALYKCMEMSKRLYERQLPRYHPIQRGAEESITKLIDDYRDKHLIHPWQAYLFKTRVKAYENDPPLLVVDEAGGVDTISSYSQLLNHLSDVSDEDSYVAIDPILNSKTHLNAKTHGAFLNALKPLIIVKRNAHFD
jgi:HD superfamily phosphohydrolase